MSDNNQGYVFLYTGEGKGKTTAALGLALRAVGHGKRVFVAQFMKGRDYGECLAAEQYLPDLVVHKCGRDSFVIKGNLSPIDIELALKGLEAVKKAMYGGKYDMVILDEINVAVDYKLIPMQDVLDLINNKPKELYLGLTGRYAPSEFIALADLVTEMKEIKHPYTKGFAARKGFEF